MAEDERLDWCERSPDGQVRRFNYSPWGITECGEAMEENLTVTEEERADEAGQMDEWASNLMGSLVSTIAMAVEDTKETPEWLEVSFSVGGQDVKIRATFQRRCEIGPSPEELAQKFLRR
jgi:hypothetical protein